MLMRWWEYTHYIRYTDIHCHMVCNSICACAVFAAFNSYMSLKIKCKAKQIICMYVCVHVYKRMHSLAGRVCRCVFASVSAFQSQPQWRRCCFVQFIKIGEEQLLFYMTLAFVYPFYFITLLVCSYADRLFSLRSSRRVRETCGKISPSRQFFLILIAFAHHPHTPIQTDKHTHT